MKKKFTLTSVFTVLLFMISACGAVGDKSESLTIIYGTTAVLSLFLLIGYFIFTKKRDSFYVMLFSSVFVVNAGYLWLAVSRSLEEALMANRLSYLGSVFLPISVFLIVLNATDTKYRKSIPWILICIAVPIFLIAASPGILDIYYKDVSFASVNGVSTLIKVYGPLHPIYMFYLLGYFTATVTVTVRAYVKKNIDKTTHAIILAIASFVNIGVWFIEQITDIEFEMLAISYIITELFLLGVHSVIDENQRLKELIREQERNTTSPARTETENNDVRKEYPEADDYLESFIKGYEELTPKERELFHAYTEGKTTKDIMAELNIKENTLKYHSRNLYGKLGVSSRKQLTAIYRRLCDSGKEFK